MKEQYIIDIFEINKDLMDEILCAIGLEEIPLAE